MDLALVDALLTHGYWIIAVAVIFFDIPTAIASGYLVKLQRLELGGVILALFIGRLSLEVVLYQLAKYRLTFLKKFIPGYHSLVKRGGRYLKKRPLLLLVSYHFVFGIKLAVPIASGLGMIKISFRRFLAYNTVGLLIWIVTMLSLGSGINQIFLSQ